MGNNHSLGDVHELALFLEEPVDYLHVKALCLHLVQPLIQEVVPVVAQQDAAIVIFVPNPSSYCLLQSLLSLGPVVSAIVAAQIVLLQDHPSGF